MQRFLSFIFLSIFVLHSRAQFFDFGFGNPFTQQQRVQHDPTPITPPKYKGGNEGINKFIQKNFRNPQERKSVDGNVIVACIIGTKGRVVEAQVIRGVSPELNEEALRVAKKLKFKPAKQGKKKVKSRFDVTFPIRHGRLSFITLETIEV